MNIYITRDGQTLGPYSDTQVRDFLKAGTFVNEDLACREGDTEWQPIFKIVRPQAIKPISIAQPAKAEFISANANPKTSSKLTTSIVIFVAIFLGVTLGGGVLMFLWSHFYREQSAKPFVVSSSATPEAVEALSKRNGELSGEVFIVTKSGENYKLGLVGVALYPLKTLEPFLDKKQEQAEKEIAELMPILKAAEAELQTKTKAYDVARDDFNKANNRHDPNASSLRELLNKTETEKKAAERPAGKLSLKYGFLHSAIFYFAGLPEPLVATQTNSDGKFTIELPVNGSYAVVARAERTVGEDKEYYFWVQKISLGGASKKTILLSNNNRTTEHSPDSLIHTSQ